VTLGVVGVFLAAPGGRVGVVEINLAGDIAVGAITRLIVQVVVDIIGVARRRAVIVAIDLEPDAALRIVIIFLRRPGMRVALVGVDEFFECAVAPVSGGRVHNVVAARVRGELGVDVAAVGSEVRVGKEVITCNGGGVGADIVDGWR
jgi:hypothetical protein